jgi:guanylate kinase
MKMNLTGKLFVIAAPSGAGKTSLVKALVERHNDLNVAISHTTRPRRAHEQDGVNYHFVSAGKFAEMQAEGEFIEAATVFDNQYGTSWSAIHSILATGKNIILEIDWQGANQIRTVIDDSVLVFILPPSMDALQNRLNHRGQDDCRVIEQRMSAAVNEMSHFGEFDFLIVNDVFEEALDELDIIIEGGGEHLSLSRQKQNLQNLLNSLLSI